MAFTATQNATLKSTHIVVFCGQPQRQEWDELWAESLWQTKHKIQEHWHHPNTAKIATQETAPHAPIAITSEHDPVATPACCSVLAARLFELAPPRLLVVPESLAQRAGCWEQQYCCWHLIDPVACCKIPASLVEQHC
jgi:hypothetical protein